MFPTNNFIENIILVAFVMVIIFKLKFADRNLDIKLIIAHIVLVFLFNFSSKTVLLQTMLMKTLLKVTLFHY